MSLGLQARKGSAERGCSSRPENFLLSAKNSNAKWGKSEACQCAHTRMGVVSAGFLKK